MDPKLVSIRNKIRPHVDKKPDLTANNCNRDQGLVGDVGHLKWQDKLIQAGPLKRRGGEGLRVYAATQGHRVVSV